MSLLELIQNWYNSNCDGDWEHMHGVKIDTLDNPGWKIEINIIDTSVEEKYFESIKNYIDDENWINCMVIDGVFKGWGDPFRLEEILKIFKDWVES